MSIFPQQPGFSPASLQAGTPALPTPDQALLSSRPRPRFPLLPMAVIASTAMIGGLILAEARDDSTRLIQWGLVILILGGVLGMAVWWGSAIAAALQKEDREVTRLEEAIRLKHFEAASWLLAILLSKPMLSPIHRLRALLGYVAMLVRAGRFEDVSLATQIMLSEGVTEPMVAPLRAANAFALLRDDRLVDAHRAIGDVRKLGRDGAAGGLYALLEMYRDVRTGHTAEVIEIHTSRRSEIASALGTRVADADALVAWAHLRLGDIASAERMWRRATLLAQPADLVERYPELKEAASILIPEPVPPEAVAPAVGGVR
jgi:hypothetical protein